MIPHVQRDARPARGGAALQHAARARRRRRPSGARIAQELHDQIGQNLTAVVLELKQVRERRARGGRRPRRRPGARAREPRGARPHQLPAAAGRARRPRPGARARRRSARTSPRRAGDRDRVDVQPAFRGSIARPSSPSTGSRRRPHERGAPRAVLARRRPPRRPDATASCWRSRDNGIGIDGRHAGAGLRGMRERAVAIGATLRTRSAPNGGVEVSLRVPRRSRRPRRRDGDAGAIRILLADDHAVVRRGLRLVLESEPDLRVVGEAGDGSRRSSSRSARTSTSRSSTSRCRGWAACRRPARSRGGARSCGS